MTRRIVLSAVVMAAVLMGGRPARAGDAAGPPDFTGDWRLDPRHSEMPPRPEAGGSGRGHMGGGGWGGGRGGMGGGGEGGWGGGRRGGRRGGGEGGSGESGSNGGDQANRDEGGGAGARPVRLPDLMHITQTAAIVSFEDSSGVVLRG